MSDIHIEIQELLGRGYTPEEIVNKFKMSFITIPVVEKIQQDLAEEEHSGE